MPTFRPERASHAGWARAIPLHRKVAMIHLFSMLAVPFIIDMD